MCRDRSQSEPTSQSALYSSIKIVVEVIHSWGDEIFEVFHQRRVHLSRGVLLRLPVPEGRLNKSLPDRGLAVVGNTKDVVGLAEGRFSGRLAEGGLGGAGVEDEGFE